MYYDLIYLIPVAMAAFVIWFFSPSLAGTREKKIPANEYAWFILCIACIPIFGFGLFLAGLFFESWYANPRELDVWFLLLIFTPWIVISGAVAAYGIRSIYRLRRRSRTPDDNG